ASPSSNMTFLRPTKAAAKLFLKGLRFRSCIELLSSRRFSRNGRSHFIVTGVDNASQNANARYVCGGPCRSTGMSKQASLPSPHRVSPCRALEAHGTRWHGRRRGPVRELSHHCLGGDQQAGDRCCTL